MKIIKQCNSFSIRVIEELDNGWNFYPKEENFSPIFIGKNQYVGKKLPKPKFWWQKNKLKICYINDFIILAKFNGTTLFEVKENQYPQKIKEALIYEQSNSQSYIKYCRLRDNKVKKDKKNDNTDRRIHLMLALVQMAHNVYTSHISKHSSYFDIQMAPLTFVTIFNHYCDMDNIKKIIGEDDCKKRNHIYFEVEDLLDSSQTLPRVKNKKLKQYLNYIIRKILHIYATDYAVLKKNLYNRYQKNELKLYKEIFHQMELLKHTNFILPQTMPQNEIKSFVCTKLII